MAHRGVVLGGLAIVIGAACGPPPPVFSAPAIAVTDRHVWMAVVATRGASPEALYVVTCPRSEAGGVQPDQCWWQTARSPVDPAPSRLRTPAREAAAPPTPPSTTGIAAEAVGAASASTGCPRERVSVQSDGTRDGVPGYWLDVCGTQRFWQWSESDGRFVDRTPSTGAQ